MNSSQTLQDFGDVLTVLEAAKVLRVSRNAMYEAVHRKDVASIRVGRRLLIPRAALQLLLAPQQQTGRSMDDGSRDAAR